MNDNAKLTVKFFGLFIACALGLYFFSYYVMLDAKERKGWFVFDPISHEHVKEPMEMDWSFDGIFGKYDRQSAQRGYQVYKEVCASCHGLRLISFRQLQDLGFSEAETKALAAEYNYDSINDDGDIEDRPGNPSDRFKSPFANAKAAAAMNNGKAPPDLSLMVKARPNGANYIYSLLTGYESAPAHAELQPGLNFNPYFPGEQIAMAAPLQAGQVEYMDGTEATVGQMSQDVVNFLQWTAEPDMEKRKRMGIKIMILLSVMTIFFYAAKVRIWARVK